MIEGLGYRVQGFGIWVRIWMNNAAQWCTNASFTLINQVCTSFLSCSTIIPPRKVEVKILTRSESRCCHPLITIHLYMRLLAL
jgi:hypothetical protein